jgi:glycosylphosphatidylinositol transamidase
VPTGSHGAFRDYQVDAVSLEFSPTFYLRNENAKSSFLVRGGRSVLIGLFQAACCNY